MNILKNIASNPRCTKYIDEKINSFFFGKKNLKVILNEANELINGVTYINGYWLHESSLYNYDEFKNIVIDNFEKIDFSVFGGLFFSDIINAFVLNELSDELYYKLLNKLNLINYKLDDNDYHKLFEIIDFDEDKLIDSVNILIRNKNTCDGVLLVIKRYFDKKDYVSIIRDNIDIILSNSNNLFYLKKLVRDEKDLVLKIDNLINSNQDKNIKDLINCNLDSFFSIKGYLNDKRYNDILDIIVLLIKDICNNEEVNIYDIYSLGRGGYSFVISIGNKVLKIGSDRGVDTYNNNPYVNAMLIRRKINIDDYNSIYIEVSEKVETKNISEEEIYELYKKIRNIHLVWDDVTFSNVGRLTKENIIHWKNNLFVTDESLGLSEYIDGPKLNIGDAVIIDNDHIYTEEDYEYVNKLNTPLKLRLEKRYQEEIRILNK